MVPIFLLRIYISLLSFYWLRISQTHAMCLDQIYLLHLFQLFPYPLPYLFLHSKFLYSFFKSFTPFIVTSICLSLGPLHWSIEYVKTMCTWGHILKKMSSSFPRSHQLAIVSQLWMKLHGPSPNHAGILASLIFVQILPMHPQPPCIIMRIAHCVQKVIFCSRSLQPLTLTIFPFCLPQWSMSLGRRSL